MERSLSWPPITVGSRQVTAGPRQTNRWPEPPSSSSSTADSSRVPKPRWRRPRVRHELLAQSRFATAPGTEAVDKGWDGYSSAGGSLWAHLVRYSCRRAVRRHDDCREDAEPERYSMACLS